MVKRALFFLLPFILWPVGIRHLKRAPAKNRVFYLSRQVDLKPVALLIEC
ncbi:hypothetical protein QE443_004741 [Pantoea ananatis]|nr:hypothetical protein [Pantoea ananatis]MDR6092177.1 hypothetical protein [Pantoea ananatis]SFY16701.1 hypothetical protein SAMN03097714_0034 [Pantoea ananatis]